MTMDGDDMRRGSNFFRKNQYKIAAVFVVAAVLGLTGMYLYNGKEKPKEPQQQAAVSDTENTKKKTVAKKETKKEVENKVKKKTEIKEPDTEQTTKVSAVIRPKPQEEPVNTETELAKEEPQQEVAEPEQTKETASSNASVSTELHFNIESGLLWPVNGAVIMDYSMDQTVYFTTLDQYKYNPAVIISGNVNDKVSAAATGKITDITTNEVTGCTVTMDLGDGYTAVYGQLKEVPYEAGAILEAGDTIGFVSEPTKYYSLEGSNLYFALEKDGAPVDPVEFFQ